METLFEFANLDLTISKIIKNTPTVTPTEFINNCQPADIILTYKKKEVFKNKYEMYLFSRFISLFQGSIFNSAKIISDTNTILGYGAFTNIATQNKIDIKKISEVSLSEFIHECGGALLLRHPNLTEKQKLSCINFIRERKGTTYATSQLIRTTWEKFLDYISDIVIKENIDITTITYNNDEVNLDELQTPLICSNLISFAYLNSGISTKFSSSPWLVWPKDFIKNNILIKVCKF